MFVVFDTHTRRPLHSNCAVREALAEAHHGLPGVSALNICGIQRANPDIHQCQYDCQSSSSCYCCSKPLPISKSSNNNSSCVARAHASLQHGPTRARSRQTPAAAVNARTPVSARWWRGCCCVSAANAPARGLVTSSELLGQRKPQGSTSVCCCASRCATTRTSRAIGLRAAAIDPMAAMTTRQCETGRVCCQARCLATRRCAAHCRVAPCLHRDLVGASRLRADTLLSFVLNQSISQHTARSRPCNTTSTSARQRRDTRECTGSLVRSPCAPCPRSSSECARHF